VIEWLVPTFPDMDQRSVIRIEAITDVAVKVVRAVEPRASSDEHTAVEPLGPIVSIRGAVVRGVVIVAVRAHGLWPDIDGDLGGCRLRNAQQSGNQCWNGKKSPVAHVFLLIPKKSNLGAKVVIAERGPHLKQGKDKRRTHA
jgi:hypothetical protein